MKITKQYLQKIIKEELTKLSEGYFDEPNPSPYAGSVMFGGVKVQARKPDGKGNIIYTVSKNGQNFQIIYDMQGNPVGNVDDDIKNAINIYNKQNK